jgi:hypothetical protein
VSNIDKLIKDDYGLSDSLRALYVSGVNDLWATIKSGNKLSEIKSQALQDNVVDFEEDEEIKKAEKDFYYNMGALTNDFLDFLKITGITGITQFVIDGRNASKNIYEFSDGLNGDDDQPRPHFE